MTAHHQGDQATPRRPGRARDDLVTSTREPTVRALPYRQIETRKSIVYLTIHLTVYLGIS
jgi:hypothetical protein